MSIGGVALSRRPKAQSNRTVRYPAPVRGVDTRQALGSGQLDSCVYTYNLVPSERGMTVRKGYREHAIGLPSGVHTIIPFDGADSLGIGDKLFVVTKEGIWDVTIKGDPPISMLTFASTTADAGYGPFTHYTNDAGVETLFYADSVNGLFAYDTVLDTWAQAAGITGPVIENVRFIVAHKQRLWMIEENSTDAWYLPVGSKAGTATEFFFGSKFKHGGSLEGLFNWTVDGGEGVDDYLVAVSHAGDVIPYKGADPSAASTWGMVGTYFIGEIPEGPFFGSEQGGELYLLSAFGLIGMGDLLQGVDTLALQAGAEGSSRTAKITGILRDEIQASISEPGWGVQSIPSEGGMLITSHTVGSAAPIQYFYNVAIGGWGFWRDVPMTALSSWQSSAYFGTEDGRVMVMDVTVDEALLTPPTEGLNGRDIEFSILTHFSAVGQDGLFKRVNMIRPDFVAGLAPTQTTVARYDYDLGEAGLSAIIDPGAGDSSASWGVSLWDVGIWGSGDFNKYNFVGGGWGIGRYVAIATKGKCRVLTRLVGWDVTFSSGGSLL